ncbi:hypothetical protein [Tenuibacillus multivorans]|uniref:hypothetical protein n=1 Tax=Tenuibacillus multivorans TaxID=237069 RepID=UPI000B88DC37|nr:hypothetical protein [Tenuibacillus multivorans]GEL76995.1 hypothetical protein TMU01_12300 [Tenuibacillus multivorans]
MRIANFFDIFLPKVNGVAKTLKRYTDYLYEIKIDYKLFIPESRAPVSQLPHVQRFMSIPSFLYTEYRLSLPNPLKIKQSLEEFKTDLIPIVYPFKPRSSLPWKMAEIKYNNGCFFDLVGV